MQVSQESPQEREDPPTVPELKLTPLFSFSLFYDIYRVCVGQASFIAKVFPPHKLTHYEREKELLTQLDHPRIIKPIDFTHALVSKLASSVINTFILFPECPRGDLLTYTKANGRLSERVARFYIKQIVQALSYAHEKTILHPQLLAQNILIDEDRNILLCGWSNSLNAPNQTLQNLFFSIGELIINLLTLKMPFISKQSKNDTFAKFLNQKDIHKLWDQIEKVVKRLNKNFQFSTEVKELGNSLFLGKMDSFKGVLSSNWLKVPINEVEVYEQLKNQECKALEEKQIKKNKAIIAQKEEKEMIRNNFALNLNRKPSRSSDIFQEEYENYKNEVVNIEQKSKSDRQLYFKIFDQDVRFIVSHLRARLKEAENEEEILVDQLLLLKDSEVSVSNSIMKVNFNFGWNQADLEETSFLCGFNHSIDVVLRKEDNQIFGRLELNEAVELNASCVHQLNNWVLDALQHHE